MKPNFVFLHGWGSDHAVFTPLADALVTVTGGHVTYVSLPGSVLSDSSISPHPSAAAHRPYSVITVDSVENQAGLSVTDYIDAVAEKLPENSFCIGWSLGGMIASAVAARAPKKISALITLATLPKFVAAEDYPHGMPKHIFDKFLSDFTRAPKRTWKRFFALQLMGDSDQASAKPYLDILASHEAYPAAEWQNTLSWLGAIDNRQALRDLRCPTLHIFGEQDAVVSMAAATHLDRFLSQHGLSSQSVLIEKNAGHLLPLTRTKNLANAIQNLQSDAGQPISAIPKQKIAQSFSRAAGVYDQVAKIQKASAQTLVEHIPANKPNQSWLDLGSGTGFVGDAMFRQGFLSRNDTGSLCEMDLSLAMVRTSRDKPRENGLNIDRQSRFSIVGDLETIPLANECMDGVVSNFALQWSLNLAKPFLEVHRVLRSGGVFAFTTLGPQTLKELRTAWQSVNDYVHVNQFHESNAIQHKLETLGFSIQRRKQENRIESFQDLMSLLKSLKDVGAHNMNRGQNPGLTHPSTLKKLANAYEQLRVKGEGLPLTYDVSYWVVQKP